MKTNDTRPVNNFAPARFPHNLEKSNFRVLVEKINSPVLIFDHDIKLIYFNNHAAHRFFDGKPLWGDSAEIHDVDLSGFNGTVEALEIFSNNGAKEKRILKTIQTSNVDKEFEITLTRMGDSAEKSNLMAEFADISEIRKQLKQIKILRNIDLAITQSPDIQHALDVILKEVTAGLAIDAAGILVAEKGKSILNIASTHGLYSKEMEQKKIGFGVGYAGQVAITQSPIIIKNFKVSSRSFYSGPNSFEESFVFYAAAPLIFQNELIGVFEVFHRTEYQTHEEWLDFFEILATQTAIALSNYQVREDLEQKNVDMLIAYDSTLEGWVGALELRDFETKDHSERVVGMTLQIAATMGFPHEEFIHLRRGALLHDIGKLGIPDDILQKQGALSDEEWEIMRQHPVMAYEWLSNISFLKDALDIPYYHHERWDGSGYPEGVKGEDIPLSARIFAIADVYDALLSDRPYRKAWSKEKTVAHIIEQSGKHFDPLVVAGFLEVFGE